MTTRNDSPEHRDELRSDIEDHQAALLIDFDNVTMGIRSNLGQELRNLLNSDVIRGNIAVQRAYADWRRYPQYIVPLSEASIDLIFAPAYGSSKKNATDIRLAIDALELVFVRPEIRTFILMSGDSDFSSLVLKLKEYGKYVIGVGIQESSSDLLVQNCDEYYSYTALSGLSKTGDQPVERHDPWVLVEKAVGKMVERGDTMRSDRLKQVMLEIDPGFNEKELGFNKFNRFVVEAASRGLVSIQKMENGQYGVAPLGKSAGSEKAGRREGKGGKTREPARGPKDGRRGKRDRDDRGRESPESSEERETRRARPKLTMDSAMRLLGKALDGLLEGKDERVRDSDVKRRLLELDPAFDEGELGYSKFSKFLQAAEEAGAVDLSRGPNGNYHVARPGRGRRERGKRKPERKEAERRPKETRAQRPAKPRPERAAKEARAESSPEEARAEAKKADEKEPTMKRLARFLFGDKREEELPPRELPLELQAPEGRGKAQAPKERDRRGGRGRSQRATGGGRSRREAPGGSEGRKEEARPRRSGGGRERRERRGERRKGPREAETARRPAEAEAQRRREPEPERGPKPKREPERKREPEPKRQPEPKREPEPAASAPADTSGASREVVEGPDDKEAAVKPAPMPGAPRGTIRGRWGSRGRYRPSEAPPPILEGQRKPATKTGSELNVRETVEPTAAGDADGGTSGAESPASGRESVVEVNGTSAGAGPSDVEASSRDRQGATEGTDSIVSQLTRYPGVGQRTAETLVDAFGADTLRVIDEEPERVRELLPDHRAERVLAARREDRGSQGG